MKISYTKWPQLTRVRNFETHTSTWDELCDLLSKHTPTDDKQSVPLIGPYTLWSGHRKDESVREVTMAVFDFDFFNGRDPYAALVETQTLLSEAGIAQHWYSTYSHSENHHAWRLLMPLEQPIPPMQWPSTRKTLLDRFCIAADPSKCGAASHAYFFPSHPIGAEGQFITIPGGPVPPSMCSPPQLVIPKPTVDLSDWSPPEGTPADPETLAAYRKKLHNRLAKLRAKEDVRAQWLSNTLACEPIADHGERNPATARVAAMIVFALPEDATVDSIYEIMRPSVERMIGRGSKLTESSVRRMIVTAMAKRERQAREERAMFEGHRAYLREMGVKIYEPLR